MVYLFERFAAIAALALALGMASAVAAHAICFWGFGQCESTNPIVGEYASGGATLTITPHQITSRTGPVSFSADYTLKSVEGKNVTVEVIAPERNETLQIRIDKDFVKNAYSSLFAGEWKRKVANP